jgi:hypothetical protein
MIEYPDIDCVGWSNSCISLPSWDESDRQRLRNVRSLLIISSRSVCVCHSPITMDELPQEIIERIVIFLPGGLSAEWPVKEKLRCGRGSIPGTPQERQMHPGYYVETSFRGDKDSICGDIGYEREL